MEATIWSLLPPIIAIVLALITKEVYVSLLIGIFAGALMFVNWNPVAATETTFSIMSEKIGDNTYILNFLVLLGILVSLITKIGSLQSLWKLGFKTNPKQKGSSGSNLLPWGTDLCR